jgi:RimJ/RimL family protein N-acetyltransferase
MLKDGIVIPGDGVTLHELWRGDANEIFKLVEANRTHLSQFGEGVGECETVDKLRELLWNPRRWRIRFGIYTDHTFVGSSFIGYSLETPREADIGYWLLSPFCGKGYMTDATSAMLRYCFDKHGILIVHARAHKNNEKSRAVLERCGFEFMYITVRGFAEYSCSKSPAI